MERIPNTRGKYASRKEAKEGRQEMYFAKDKVDNGHGGIRGPIPPGRGVVSAFDPGLLLARVEEHFRQATKGGYNRLQIVPDPDLPKTLFGDEACLQKALSQLAGFLSKCVEGATIQISTTIQKPDTSGVPVSFGMTLIEGPETVIFPEERGAADLENAMALARAMGGAVIGPHLEGSETVIQLQLTFPGPGSWEGTGNPTGPEASKGSDETGPAPGTSNRARRILLAEDNRVTRAVTRKVLQKRGHEVSVAANGREAVEKVKEHTFDVVLMDLEMPEMDGLTATQLIRALPSLAPPIIAYTAFTSPENRRQCKQVGVDEILAKPVSCGDLFHEVERWPRRLDL